MKSLFPFALHLGALALLDVHYHRTSPPSPEAVPAVTHPTVIAQRLAAPVDTLEVEPTLPVPPSPQDPPLPLTDQIALALRSGSAAERDHALYRLLPRLIADDPSAAGHLALAWEPGLLRDEFLRQVIHHWSEADIGGVLTWLTALLDADDRRLAAATTTAQVAQADPAGALDLSQVLRVGLEDGSFEHLAQLWTEEEPAAAVNWVMAQPAGPVRDRLLARIAWVRGQSDPAEAAGLVLKHMQPGEAQTSAVVSVVRQWAVRDPAEAAEWVAHFPVGPLQTRALTELETARKLAKGK